MSCGDIPYLILVVLQFFIIALLLLAEFIRMSLLKRGRGAAHHILLPFYRTLLVVYCFSKAFFWTASVILSSLFPDVSQTWWNLQMNTPIILTPIQITSFCVFWTSTTCNLSINIASIKFLSLESAGKDSITIAKHYALIPWFILLPGFVLATYFEKYPVSRLLFILVSVWSISVGIYSLYKRKSSYKPAVVLSFWYGLMIAAQMIFYDEPCIYTVFEYTFWILHPLIIYCCFLVHSEYWRTLCNTFLDDNTMTVLTPIVTEYFPSRMVLDYNSFIIEEQLGCGAQASVFSVKNKKGKFAMKKFSTERLTSEIVKNFISEAFILHQISPHMNVMQIEGICVSPPYFCLVTELCEMSLHSYLRDLRKKGENLPFYDCLVLARDIALGLYHLHSHCPPIVHHDLKSLNVLLKFDNLEGRLVAKIADMGNSHFLRSKAQAKKRKRISIFSLVFFHRPVSLGRSNQTLEQQEQMLQLSTPLGTVPWSAPEVLKARKHNEKCDIFSLGVLFWELFSGLDVFECVGRKIFAYESVNGFRLPIGKVQNQLIAPLIESCWQNSPLDRPSALDVIGFLDTFIVATKPVVV